MPGIGGASFGVVPHDGSAPKRLSSDRRRAAVLGSGAMARLKLGFIPSEGGQFYREALGEGQRAEDTEPVANHYWPSPFTVLAGFPTRTSRLTLGTDIAVAAFYHPVRLAEDVALLDVMSGG